MKNCKKCGANIPNNIMIDGKLRNLQNRTLCLQCLPFGESKYRKKSPEEIRTYNAEKARKYYEKKKRELGADPISIVRNKRKVFLVELFGGKCQCCGYNKTYRNLAFHHIDSTQKELKLSSRELQFNLERVLGELNKCILVCHNCHGEIHEGLIDVKHNPLDFSKLNGKTWRDVNCGIH